MYLRRISLRKRISNSRISRGFTLLETLIAIFMFSAVMMSVTVYFVNIAKTNKNSKLLQQNLEDVSFAMNRIAKVLRTSAVVKPVSSSSVQTIRVYDYSQGKCIEYKFFREEMIERVASEIVHGDPLSWCESRPSGNFNENAIVSTGNGASLSGTFFAVPSDDSPITVGRVTMNATITRGALSSTIQTSVSLRNYK